MTEERRRFLEQAMASMCVNVVSELELAAKVLTSATSTEEEQVAALEAITDYTDDVDAANDFCKIGGLQIILPLLLPERPTTVRRRIANLIAGLAQNNPFCQQQLLELDGLQLLLPLADEPDVASDAMRGISCLVRCYEPASAKFIELGGLECTLNCLRDVENNEKLVVRSLFLLRGLCMEYPKVVGE